FTFYALRPRLPKRHIYYGGVPAVCLLFVLLAGIALPGRAGAPAYDLVIAHGRVMDPATSTDRIANVGIKGDRIAAICAAPLDGARTMEARGLVVAPGFIDI